MKTLIAILVLFASLTSHAAEQTGISRGVTVSQGVGLLGNGGGGGTNGPALFFTDLISGPKTGGENNNGAYITIYGMGFGATQGASTVTVGGGLVNNCPIWGATWQWYQKTVCQLGSLTATGNIVVTVSGNASNTLPFTVRSGNIFCVSTAGNDANAGTFPSSCWRTIPKAKNTIAAGDIAYIRSGVSQTAQDNFSASLSMDNAGGDNNGTQANPKAIVGYPGETATIGAYSTNGGQAYGMRTPNIAFNDDYWVFAELTLRGGTQASDISAHGWRVIGMDVSACCNTSQVGAFQFNGGDHSAGQPMQYILGNEVHDSGPSPAADKFYHALYLSTDSNYFDVGWNHIHNNFTCRAIQVHSSPVCDPSCGVGSDTTGFFQFDLHFHHNKIHDDNCDGINLASTNPSAGVVEIYNNLIYSVGKRDSSDGSGTFYCVRGNGTNNYARASSGNIDIYNNTMYDCGSNNSAVAIANGRGAVQNDGNSGTEFMVFKNNIIRQLVGEIYTGGFDSPSLNNGDHNDWFGVGSAPSFTTSNSNVDPVFVNPGTDFHLQGSSTLINNGTNGKCSATDLEGVTRPKTTTCDIGAYEQ